MSGPPRIPNLDLSRGVAAILPQVEARWRRIVAGTAFVLGEEVRSFEAAFARQVGAAGCVGVGNGTDALVLALHALGAGPGDEVVVPAFSFFATAEAVVLVGARPVFADVDPQTLNLTAEEAARRATPETVGVLAVHLYGRPCDGPALAELCAERGWWLVEDAAQAHGARLGGRPAGSFGALAAWSFYPTKNLACFGDGGAVTGGDAELLERLRRLANHGQVSRHLHTEIGTNSRLDSLQAAVLNVRLPRLAADNAKRRELAARYREALAGVGDLRFPADPPGAEPVYHQMVVRTGRREALLEHLAARGVGAAVHYPVPMHRQPAIAALGAAVADLPHAERAAREVLSLPMFPELTEAEVDAVCQAVREFFVEG